MRRARRPFAWFPIPIPLLSLVKGGEWGNGLTVGIVSFCAVCVFGRQRVFYQIPCLNALMEYLTDTSVA